MKNAIVYVNGLSASGNFLRTQISLCKKFSFENHFHILRYYIDCKKKSFFGRSALHALLADRHNPAWENIIVLTDSDFIENHYLLLLVRQELNLAGKRLISITENKN